MSIYLFSINFEILFSLAIIFIFLLPLFLNLIKNKVFNYVYLIMYLIILFVGVLFDISINYKEVSFSVLITNNWFSNAPIFANFAFLGIVINLLLLFPLGTILPLINTKTSIYKTILYGFTFSLLIEFLQFSLPIKRYPELLDVINNTISVILGYMYYIFINRLLIRSEKNDRISKQEGS